jgi:hypothetical protein
MRGDRKESWGPGAGAVLLLSNGASVTYTVAGALVAHPLVGE